MVLAIGIEKDCGLLDDYTFLCNNGSATGILKVDAVFLVVLRLFWTLLHMVNLSQTLWLS